MVLPANVPVGMLRAEVLLNAMLPRLASIVPDVLAHVDVELRVTLAILNTPLFNASADDTARENGVPEGDTILLGAVPVLAMVRFAIEPPLNMLPYDWLAVPLKITVLPVIEPVTAVALPPMLSVLVPVFNMPELSAKLPVTFVAVPKVTVPDAPRIRFLMLLDTNVDDGRV